MPRYSGACLIFIAFPNSKFVSVVYNNSYMFYFIFGGIWRGPPIINRIGSNLSAKAEGRCKFWGLAVPFSNVTLYL